MVGLRLCLIRFLCLKSKVHKSLRKSVLVVVKELFDLPLETKQRNVSEKLIHGYVGQWPNVPLYESIGVDDANIIEKVESLENTLWPEGYLTFRSHPIFFLIAVNYSFSSKHDFFSIALFCYYYGSKAVQAFSEQLSELDQIVRRMILESLGVEKYLDEHMNSTNYLLRVMKYTAPQTEDAKLGLTTHTDKNIVTILCQNEVAGLEVETKDGKWITYQPSSPHCFIVLTGDSFHAWTNGRLHSAFHRVMLRGNEARYSVGLFSKPKEHPLLFKPFDHAEFLSYCYTEEGLREKFPLKTYCGV